MKEPNFSSYICQAFESYSNEKRTPQQPKIADDIISNVCKTLKLSELQTVAVAFALIEWPSADAIKFLKAKLPEIALETSLEEVHNDLLHGLYLFISLSDVSVEGIFSDI